MALKLILLRTDYFVSFGSLAAPCMKLIVDLILPSVEAEEEKVRSVPEANRIKPGFPQLVRESIGAILSLDSQSCSSAQVTEFVSVVMRFVACFPLGVKSMTSPELKLWFSVTEKFKSKLLDLSSVLRCFFV